MTITLKPSTEALLLEKAQQEGQDPDTLANDVLAEYLAAEAPVSAAEIRAAIQAERAKPIEQYIAEQRIKHGYSSDWPQRDAVHEIAPGEFVNTIEHD